MFVKVCGITRPADAVAAVDAGVDAIGLNFVPTSRRCIDVEVARAILAVVPSHVMTVGIFRDRPAEEILDLAGALGIDAAQLHGDEPPEVTLAVAAGVGTVIKAVVAGSPSIHSIDEHAADIILLDAPIAGGGKPFAWDLVGDLATQHRILLAGGLRPDNVAEAIRRVRPWGVDVASGVESEPARKDPDAIARFVAEARAGGQHPAERPLEGGIANAGQVVRVGPHVLRPSTPHSGSVHAFLRSVRDAGFEGAPSPVGIDEDGRERLVFIEGEVPVAPHPDWSQSDRALASIARLLRELHDAAHHFDPRGLSWNDVLADPAGGTIVCHNDVELSNVVFRNGVAVALLDFEFAAPGRPVYDLAQFARLCVPIDHDFDQARLGWRPADRPARLRLVADAYGLDREGRAELISAMDDAIDRIEAAARRSLATGHPNAVAVWHRTGGSEKYARRRGWWSDHHERFVAALH